MLSRNFGYEVVESCIKAESYTSLIEHLNYLMEEIKFSVEIYGKIINIATQDKLTIQEKCNSIKNIWDSTPELTPLTTEEKLEKLKSLGVDDRAMIIGKEVVTKPILDTPKIEVYLIDANCKFEGTYIGEKEMVVVESPGVTIERVEGLSEGTLISFPFGEIKVYNPRNSVVCRLYSSDNNKDYLEGTPFKMGEKIY
jgi:hypothetical protein